LELLLEKSVASGVEPVVCFQFYCRSIMPIYTSTSRGLCFGRGFVVWLVFGLLVEVNGFHKQIARLLVCFFFPLLFVEVYWSQYTSPAKQNKSANFDLLTGSISSLKQKCSLKCKPNWATSFQACWLTTRNELLPLF